MSPAALVTGGTSGIGLATAQLLYERGFRVAVTGSRPESLERAAGQLPADVLTLRADARSAEDADRVAAEVANRFGRLTFLFLNAGVVAHAAVPDVEESTWDDLFAVNAKGQFRTLQATLPHLVDGGSIVVTVGVGVNRGIPGGVVSAGSRGALLAMVPSLAAELAPRRIRVNAVSPGAIDTPIWDGPGRSADDVARTKQTLAAQIPFGRLGTPRDVAEVVAFLASDGAGYVTGQNIAVAGGL